MDLDMPSQEQLNQIAAEQFDGTIENPIPFCFPDYARTAKMKKHPLIKFDNKEDI